MRTIIIGGGASGLMCAIKAKNNSNEVILLEKNSQCGKKILVTGNGKCNYFNDDFHINHYHSENLDILETIINEKTKRMVLDMFDSMGVVAKIKDGYYYPFTNQAITIRETLVNKAISLGVKIITDIDIREIKYDNRYIISTNDGVYTSDNLVLATSLKAFNGNTFGLDVCKKFNHTIIDPKPALVQLVGKENYFKEWAGIRTDVSVSLIVDGKTIKSSAGEIQLTDYGVSGICIFQLSSLAAKYLYVNKSVSVEINFIPYVNTINNYLDERYNKTKASNISELLDGMLNYKLVNLILKKNNIDRNTKFEELSLLDKNNIMKSLTTFKVNIIDTMGFSKAQVCSGGIPLDEINIHTMKSNKQNNLYIIGELLDVDGECGGFNLGFAFISGYLAGVDINDKN